MSLMTTLAKVALGVAVARGVGKMMQGGQTQTASKGGGGLLGGLIDAIGGGQQASGRSSGGLEDMLTNVLGGKGGAGTGTRINTGAKGAQGGLGGILDALTQSENSQRRAQSDGGLGDLLGGLLGGKPASGASTASSTGSSTGGLGDILGALAGAAGGAAAGKAASGGLGDLLGGLLGGGLAQQGAQASNDRSFGEVLNSALTNKGEPDVAPTPAQNAAAALMLSAMLQAAKSDGKLDAAEKDKLMGNLGEISAEERDFIQKELARPVDVQGLARQVPKGLEAQVYTMSVMAIDLDNEAEARYLHSLAQAMDLGRDEVNAIHEQLGAPALYA